MARLDFFAAEADQRDVFDFLFSSTDVRVFESRSDLDQELTVTRFAAKAKPRLPTRPECHHQPT